MRWLFHGAVLSLRPLSEAAPHSLSGEVKFEVVKSFWLTKKPNGFLEPRRPADTVEEGSGMGRSATPSITQNSYIGPMATESSAAGARDEFDAAEHVARLKPGVVLLARDMSDPNFNSTVV